MKLASRYSIAFLLDDILKSSFLTALLMVSLAVPARGQGSLTPSLGDIQRNATKGTNAHQRLTDRADRLATQSPWGKANSIGSVPHSGAQSSNKLSVPLRAPETQAQRSLPGSRSGNPPQQNMRGVTLLPYPREKQSHFGPPQPSDYPILRYQPPFHADAAPQFATNAMGQSSFEAMPQQAGIPLTDTAYQANKLAAASKFVDQVTSPGRWVKASEAANQAQQQQASDAAADGAENFLGSSLESMKGSLINVANESSGIPVAGDVPLKLEGQAVWIVQKMLKQVYLPMALLFLLPGAVLTQVKGLVTNGMLGGTNSDDVASPFSGIIRSVVAIFLIPATQLIVSYAIDIGNSLTFELQQHLDTEVLMSWARQQTFNPPAGNERNAVVPPLAENMSNPDSLARMENSPKGRNPSVRGKATNGPEEQSEVEQQSMMTRLLQLGFNMAGFMLSTSLAVLLGFQLVMMCYLYLLGPTAAALYAWPGNVGTLFKKVFANWVDAVTNLALWRFWWSVIALSMTTRIQWLKETESYAPNSQWEMMMFAAFMVMMTYVPFMPFEFRPGELAAKVLEKANEFSKGSGGGEGTPGANGAGGGGIGGGASAAGAGAAAPANAFTAGGGALAAGSFAPGAVLSSETGASSAVRGEPDYTPPPLLAEGNGISRNSASSDYYPAPPDSVILRASNRDDDGPGGMPA